MNLATDSTNLRFNAYVDGFNLYKGALANRPDLKWLDIKYLCQKLMPGLELETVYYFTSPIKNRFAGDTSNERQLTYLRVLRNSGVNVVNGHFRKDSSWERLVSRSRTKLIEPNLSPNFGLTQLALNRSWKVAHPDVPKVNIWTFKEKGSDVNLASHLLRDAYQSEINQALVISGDSDLTTAVRFSRDAGTKVRVVFPNRNRIPDSLKTASSSFETLRNSDLRDCQFPKTFVSTSGRQINKPSEWA